MFKRTDTISPHGVDVVGAGLARQNLSEADGKPERNLNKHKHFENIHVYRNADSDIEQQSNLNNSIDNDFEEDSEHEKYNTYIASNSISSDIESDVDRDELQPKSSPEDRRYSWHLSSNINPYPSTFSAEEARLRFSLESVQYKDRAVAFGASPNLDEACRPTYTLNDSMHDVNKLSAGINSQSSSPNPKSFQISPQQGFQGEEQGSRSSLNLSFDEDSNAAFIPRIKEGLYFCHLCSFSGSTQQDFDLHMTVHFEHVCPHCDYKSRTEGRLKRHIKDFHTEDPDGGYGARAMPGRPKVFRCKQCEYSTIDKLEFWSHSRSHIKEDKLLQCPRCPFVTEYKHHLEYHLRNHFGSKPFKCPKCNYACVNKSMLNSHMKSHTNVYQYRCADCTYATKYCHSLKLHLRKYIHKPAAVLNSDGSLPQGVDATASGLSLLAKRGPPRGPRGPRKDKMDPGMNSFHPMPISPVGPMPAMQGMIPPPFWPMMHNQFPGSFPGPLGLGHRFNTHLPGMPVMTQVKLPEEIKSPTGGNPSHNPNKCNFCNFVGTNHETLMSHVMKVHATENRDLFSMFGLSSESLLEDSQMRMNPSHMFRIPIKFPRMENMTGNPPECFHGIKKEFTEESPKIKAINENDGEVKETTKISPFPFVNGKFQVDSQFLADSHKAKGGMDILKQMTLKFGSGPVDLKPKLPSMLFSNNFTTADSPLDLTKPRHTHMSSYQTTSAFHSYKDDEAEGDSSGENSAYSNEITSPPPRKRSRKGKAFKLDTLVMKLQEKKKDANNSNEDSDVDMDEMYTSDLLPVKIDKNPAEHQAKYEESIDVEENSSFKIKSSDMKETDKKKNQTENEIVDKEENDSSGNIRNVDDESFHKVSSSPVLPNENEGKDNDKSDLAQNEGSKSISNGDILNFSSNENISSYENISSTQGFTSLSQRKSIPAAIQHRADIAWKILNDLKMRNPSDIVKKMGSVHKWELSPLSKKLWNETPNYINTLQKTEKGDYECPHCQIFFGDCIMYTMHMGYHGYKDPYKCNMCGDTCKDRVEFFLHIARAAHK